MRKRRTSINLADRQASMDLLKQLYGTEVKDDSGTECIQTQDTGDRRGQGATSTRSVDEVHESACATYSK